MSHGLTQSHSLELDLRVEFAQGLAQTIALLRKEGGGNPPDLLKDVIGVILARIPEGPLKQAITATFTEESIRNQIILRPDAFAAPTQRTVMDFTLDLLYHTSTADGVFIHAINVADRPSTEPFKTTRQLFGQAYRDREGLKNELVVEQERLKNIARKRSVSFLSVNEMSDALAIVEAVTPAIESIQYGLLYLLAQKDDSGRPILRDFCLDSVVLKQLDFLLSERLYRRFVKRFQRARYQSSAADFEEAFMNTIGDYTLISMGIISPDVFEVQSGELPSDLFETTDVELANTGFTMKSLAAYYGLRTEGTFFWNRYQTMNVRPCRVTDELIRRFITETVRVDRAVILAASRYAEEFFPGVVDICSENRPHHREEPLRRHLAELCKEPGFQGTLIELLKKWHKHLSVFYPKAD
ncbi:MAG: hypothetical protein AAB365_01990 [Patescibacteria group bacterium]